MDKLKLSDILFTNDDIVSMQDLIIMERLAVKYPYCSVFKITVTKFAYILNNFNKAELLHLTNVYISDREHFKNVIANIKLLPKQKTINVVKTKKDDIINKINSYQDEQLSEIPTKQELLEKFLKIEDLKPKTPNETTSEYNDNIDKAIKESANKEFGIVTETMAKIYAKQGDKNKAIKIYQQLMADNPKKSIYFANQIENLKNNN